MEAGRGVPTMPDYVAPGENIAGVFAVDLSSVCNMGLADETAGDGKGGWSDEGPFNDMRCLKAGDRTFYGVPFRIIDPEANGGRSIITLRSRISSQALPQVVTIPMPSRHCRALYFLHAAAWGTPGTIGEYIIVYADGDSVRLPLTIPGNIANWWDAQRHTETARAVPIRVTNTASGKPAWRYVRVWEWQNPRHDVAIKTLEVRSAGGQQMLMFDSSGAFDGAIMESYVFLAIELRCPQQRAGERTDRPYTRSELAAIMGTATISALRYGVAG